MLPFQRRHRRGRVLRLVLIGLLLLVSVSLAGYRFFRDRERGTSDPELLRELQRADRESFHSNQWSDESPKWRPDPLDPAVYGDWPNWRGEDYSNVSRETGWSKNWSKEGPKLVWEADPGSGFGCPVIQDYRVVTLGQDGTDEAVACWDANTGKETWRFKYASHYVNGYGSGPRATPTIAKDHVYAVGATGVMHCLTLATGAKAWRRDLLSDFNASNLQWGVSFSPLVANGRVYVVPGGSNGNSLVALDASSGEISWKTGSDRAGYSSPVPAFIAEAGQVLFFTASNLVGVNMDTGAILWTFPWQTDFDCNVATPIVRGDYIFISSNYGKGCALVKIEAKDDGTFQARRVYENNQMCNHFASSVLFGEHLYGFNDTILTCMEFRTGAVVWKEKGFKKGSLLVADGHLLVLSEDGRLVLAEATPKGFAEKASFRPSRVKCWTAPVLAHGRLYIRDEEKLRCYDLRP